MIQVVSCSQHRMETHRALELLSDYYARLTKSPEKQLLIEMERFMRVLKSRFFQALIDIQEYYEIALLDGIKVDNLIQLHNHVSLNSLRNYSNDRTASPASINNTKYNNNNNNNNNIAEYWNYTEIVLKRNETGLGFSIAGGTDNPHIQNDYSIYVTKIIPKGSAANDGRLRINDIIEKVNDSPLVNLTHSAAVDILKGAGDLVKLYVCRKNFDYNITEIELLKGANGFGFSIAGGIGNQHIPGDNGIYITKIQDNGAAQLDNRLKVGQKLVAVKNLLGYRDLGEVSHEEAVEALTSTKDKILLYILEPEHNKFNENFSRRDPPVLKDNPVPNKLAKQVCLSNPPSSIECLAEPNNSVDQSDSHSTKNKNSDANTRTIILNKGSRGLGFNIVGGEDGVGIFISYILEGGPADIDGKLMKGDRVVDVNGTDFSNISHEEAATILKETVGEVTITVQYDIEGYNRFESKLNTSKDRWQQSLNTGTLIKTTEKKSMYVRALFDYDPNNDDDLPSLGLSFAFGDILHVTNGSDDEWWLATKVFPETNEAVGIIPAKKRWERKQRSRDRSVKFEGHAPVLFDKQAYSDKRKKNYSFSRKFPFMKNKDEKLEDYFEQEPFMLCYTQEDGEVEDPGSKEILYRVELPFMEELTLVYLENDAEEENKQQLCDEVILSYEIVENITTGYTRPVIILGPLKDKINDDLITEFPEKFASCVPHTTRTKRDKEIDGRDYHFVLSREQMEKDIQNHMFIEAGQYNENLYGTSIAAVNEVALQGKHCILDVSGNAIKRLYAAQLYPIALFVKVSSPDSLLNMNPKITEDQAKKMFYRALRIEQEFVEHFTGIIHGETYQDIYEKVKQNIFKQSSEKVWVPCKLHKNA